ncbi:MAG: hypothetical protein K0S27_1549 [Gammaproteobacteria bacterium]|jgi:hypothetical protein|nr:hypothetical protein [Gammaproteobacteria bacterium]
MVLKRLLLFFIGLLYGILVNSIAFGIFYGLNAIKESLRGGVFPAEGPVLLLFIGIAFAIGFVPGALYGMIIGSWHCAMDFYNNGLRQGLTSPFRFLSALWKHKINNDSTELKIYYASTDINLLAEKEKATERVLNRAKLIHTLLEKRNREKGLSCPPGISLHIVSFAGCSDLQLSGNDTIRNIAHTIQNQVLPLSAEEKESSSLPESDNKITVAKFLTPAEINNLLHGFFYPNKSASSSPHSASPISSPRPVRSP